MLSLVLPRPAKAVGQSASPCGESHGPLPAPLKSDTISGCTGDELRLAVPMDRVG